MAKSREEKKQERLDSANAIAEEKAEQAREAAEEPKPKGLSKSEKEKSVKDLAKSLKKIKDAKAKAGGIVEKKEEE